eukprot:scaffold1120_cov127-Cylindrotheca_fusiformis.AAC.13
MVVERKNGHTPHAKEEKDWKLEESYLWWLSLPVFQNPGNVLLFSSIPFCIGGYIGYKKPTKRLEELVGSKENGMELALLPERRRLGIQLARRALRLATLGTVGTFGMLGAATFYASGYQTLDEAVNDTKRWASSYRQSFEDWLAIEDRPSKTHPEVVATKHMSEEQELNYIYEKYIKEPEGTRPSEREE